MNKNPYDVLGVSQTASDDEIKEAYRALARKYHPDKYADEGLKEMATAKMQEINEAYDTIKNLRAKTGGSYTGGSYTGGYNGYGTYGNYGASDSYDYEGGTTFADVRRLINSGAFSRAESILDNMPTAERNAEWYFLRGCILLRRGWYHDAEKYFDTACKMDPENKEYRDARVRLGRDAASSGRASYIGCGDDPCSCCSTLMCADCCCECMGGDLIPCC